MQNNDSTTETRLSTIDLFCNPIERGYNQTIGTKKNPKTTPLSTKMGAMLPICTVEYYSVHRITMHARFYYNTMH